MLRKLYTLSWAQWRQQRPALMAIWAFTGGSFFLAAYVDSNTAIYMDEDLVIYPSVFLWFAGIVLIFMEQNAVGLYFHFPSRLATLPLRTSLLLGTTLLSRILLTMLHTVLCFLFLFLNSDRWSFWTTNLLLLPVILTFGIQWAAYLQVRNNTPITCMKIFAGLVILILGGGFLTMPISESGQRVTATLILISLPLAGLCIRTGYIARHGAGTWKSGANRPHLTEKAETAPRPGLLHRLPVSPVSTQIWFECRNVTLWFPVLLVATTFLIVAPATLLTEAEFDVFDSPIGGLGVGIAFAVGALWEFTDKNSKRFLLAVPVSELTLTRARIWAAAIATTLALLGIAVILGAAILYRMIIGTSLFPAGIGMPYLFALAVATAPVWYVSLIYGRAFILTTVVPVVLPLAVLSTFFMETIELWFMSLPFLAHPIAVFAGGSLLYKRCGIPLPWAWLSVAILALLPIYDAITPDESSLFFRPDRRIGDYIIASCLLAAALHYARSANLVSKKGRNRTVVAFAMLTLVGPYVLDSLPYNAGLVESHLAPWLTLALMMPLGWFPLLNRWQRNA